LGASGVTPRESMPELVQNLMLGVGSVFFVAALRRFRRSVTQTQV